MSRRGQDIQLSRKSRGYPSGVKDTIADSSHSTGRLSC